MDRDTRDLIDQLCTQAGMIMEDCSTAFLTTRRIDDEEIPRLLQDLAGEAAKVRDLVNAAIALSK
ncbi:MAG: hypothetical protein ACREB7_07110 [Sphingopyxis sp.]|uniref:hypothetical protein n=1 Tax=Sphingopyxis sp. TaxID=1908224 RepID=UPI003D6CECB5